MSVTRITELPLKWKIGPRQKGKSTLLQFALLVFKRCLSFLAYFYALKASGAFPRLPAGGEHRGGRGKEKEGGWGVTPWTFSKASCRWPLHCTYRRARHNNACYVTFMVMPVAPTADVLHTRVVRLAVTLNFVLTTSLQLTD